MQKIRARNIYGNYHEMLSTQLLQILPSFQQVFIPGESGVSELHTHTVKKKLKCSGDSEILHEFVVSDTTRKSEKHELIRVVSRSRSSTYIGIPATLHLIFYSVHAVNCLLYNV